MSQDFDLQKAVLSELNWEPSVVAAHIGVTANAGVVTLTGHVATYAEKRAAETAAARVKGVKAVAENIEVRLAFETQRSDDELATAALQSLGWSDPAKREAIKVKVENGWVTLTGEVDWHYQEEAAEEDVRRLFGVVGVSNQIKIKPRVSVSDISDDITHALHRSWLFDPKTIDVTAEGGRVRLNGTVHSLQEKSTAAMTAWAAPGATAVENNLAVV